MGRGRHRVCEGLRVRQLTGLAALLLLVASCTNTGGVDDSTTSSRPSDRGTTTTSTTVALADDGGGVTTTTAPVSIIAGPELGIVVTLPDRIEMRAADGSVAAVLGDESRRLRIAFDDLNGGLVYQYVRTPPEFGADAILHLPRGAATPTTLLTAGEDESIELIDVSLLDGLVTVLAAVERSNETALVALRLAGGAPTEVLTIGPGGVDPPSDNDFLYRAVVGGAVGGDLISHLIVSDGDCQFAEARRSDQRFFVDPLVTACDAGAATLVDIDVDGTLLAYVIEGDGSASVRGIDLERLAPTGQPSIPPGGMFLDVANDIAIVTYSDGYLLTDFLGTRFEELPGEVVAVTAMRSLPTLPSDAFLGGFRTPATCSGFDVSPIGGQAALPPLVAAKRTAIGDAITRCDFLELNALTGPSFTASFGGGEALDLWAEEELIGLTPFADIARTLELPYTIIEGDATDIYVWPSAFGDDPTEADWVALEALYNEEEIELWRNDGFVGLRIGITERGTWIFAVAGD